MGCSATDSSSPGDRQPGQQDTLGEVDGVDHVKRAAAGHRPRSPPCTRRRRKPPGAGRRRWPVAASGSTFPAMARWPRGRPLDVHGVPQHIAPIPAGDGHRHPGPVAEGEERLAHPPGAVGRAEQGADAGRQVHRDRVLRRTGPSRGAACGQARARSGARGRRRGPRRAARLAGPATGGSAFAAVSAIAPRPGGGAPVPGRPGPAGRRRPGRRARPAAASPARRC